jgi:sugar lactone lactonase YvrE
MMKIQLHSKGSLYPDIRKVSLIVMAAFLYCQSIPAQTISTLAGNGTSGYMGDGGAATAAELSFPYAVAVDAAGNVYVADQVNHCIRKINTSGIISTVAGTGVQGNSGDGGLATSANLYLPTGVAVDGAGNIYIADYFVNRIRKVNTSGIISTIAGSGAQGFSGDGGPATSAKFYWPGAVAVDGAGNLYISDQRNNRIRKVNTAGIITTIAGNGIQGYTGDGGVATTAAINSPQGLGVDAAGNVYFSDGGNNHIRKISTAGIITNFAGNGINGFSGDGGQAGSAAIFGPDGIMVDANGAVYFADSNNNRIRVVNAYGFIYSIAGDGTGGFAGDGGPATAAELYSPEAVAVDANGNIFIADRANMRIRKVTMNAGINEHPLSSRINVFPVPGNGLFTANLSGNGYTGVKIYDALGRKVYDQQLETTEQDIHLTIDITTVRNGLYFMQIQTENEVVNKQLEVTR